MGKVDAEDAWKALDYNYNNVPSYYRTEGYIKRLNILKEWLLSVDSWYKY